MKTITAKEIQEMVFIKDFEQILSNIKKERSIPQNKLEDLPIIVRIKDYETGFVWDGNNMNSSAIMCDNKVILEFVRMKEKV